MKIEEKLGLKIKQLRNKIGISQEELAFRCDLHRTYISSVELGKRNVSIRNIEKIALALNVEIFEFFEKANV
ncbi:helix-turn-helix domain-containing protein [Tenacibaculum ovolyticum]|uniref:helix-turn-helix domain-containing protein n=1 Tax=Tenacibaculum ovolyticum TaxID=104270 RepID=UPI0007EDCAEA|nr:helix-turn-helix transcriptional regulator [Tenacibaculum ovolyticum]